MVEWVVESDDKIFDDGGGSSWLYGVEKMESP